MYKAALIIAGLSFAFSVSLAHAAPKSAGAESRNSAPGQQMLNKRTSATAPGNSFNAPGQKMIRQRTPGGTK
jgi:hypothetical protein